METRRFCAVSLWLAALCIVTNAFAQTSVTACGIDSAAGGMNLRAAVALGGLIDFKCGPNAATIKVTAPLQIKTATQIDGGGRIVLQGPGAGSMFIVTAPLELANMQVKNEGAGAAGIVRSRTADLVLRGVGTTDTASAYVVASLSARDSNFEANGAPGGSAGVVIDAERIQLSKTTFSKNFDHPTGGGQVAASRTPLSRQVSIDSSVFADNSASLLTFDASVVIRNSKFLRNGAATADAGAWGCCAGALTGVNSKIEIVGTEFIGNVSTGFGGAVMAIGTDLRLVKTRFEGNRARVGGAIFSWAQPPRNNIWSTRSGTAAAPGLSFSQARFRQNTAQFGGGAVGWSGSISGDSALFAQNSAESGGAMAHWSAVNLPPAFEQAFSQLVAMTTPSSQSLRLSRGVFVENFARVAGAAISGGGARVALGNALVVRNLFLPANAQGAALEGDDLDLANSSVAENTAGGIRLSVAGQRARLVNTLIVRNTNYGCNVPAAKLVAITASMQFPGNDCVGVTTGDGQLETNYKPSLGGPASDLGNVSICISEPLVAALDLSAVSRGNRGLCAVGAYEPDPLFDPVAGWIGADNAKARWVVFWLLLLCLLMGFLLAFVLLRQGRRKHKAAPDSCH